jgi:hypothetical protein
MEHDGIRVLIECHGTGQVGRNDRKVANIVGRELPEQLFSLHF